MRIVLILLLLPLFSLPARAQEDPELTTRFEKLMKATRQLEIPTILDYTYPKLFTLVPRETMVTIMEQSFDSEELGVTLDSLAVHKVFPIFSLGEGKYAKLLHTMVMRMKMKQEKTDEELAQVLEGLQEKFGKENVRYEKKENTIVVFKLAVVVAIKDSYSREWTFINYIEDEPLADMLFSKELISKLSEFK